MTRTLAAIALGSFLLPHAALAGPSNNIEDVKLRPGDGRVDLVLKTTAPPTFQSFAKHSPPVVIVDLVL